MREQAAVDEAAKYAADQRRHPEKPKLAESPSANKERLAGAARRIDGGVGDGNADEVDEREAQANGDGREAFGSAYIGRSHDNQQEKGCENNLSHQAGKQGIV